MTPVIKTSRLYLRQITQDDAELLHGIFSDPIAMQFYPKTLDLNETRQWIDKVMANYEKHGIGMYACHLLDNDEFVGHVGIHFHPDIDGVPEVEVGYLLLRKHWHQGYATEAAKACMQFARDKLKRKRIISLIRPENKPSIRVAERNNLMPEKEVVYKTYKHIIYVSDE